MSERFPSDAEALEWTLHTVGKLADFPLAGCNTTDDDYAIYGRNNWLLTVGHVLDARAVRDALARIGRDPGELVAELAAVTNQRDGLLAFARRVRDTMTKRDYRLLSPYDLALLDSADAAIAACEGDHP